MSRRRNETNRAGCMVGASRYTGYARPKKKTDSLSELNGLLKKSLYSYYSWEGGENQDVRTND